MRICIKVNKKNPDFLFFRTVEKINGGFYEIEVTDKQLEFFKTKFGKKVKTYISNDDCELVISYESKGEIKKGDKKVRYISFEEIDEPQLVVRADKECIYTEDGPKERNVVVLAHPNRQVYYTQYLKKGYSDWDLYDMDGYLSQLIGTMVEDFGKINVGIWPFPDKNGVYHSDKKKTDKMIKNIAKAFSSYNKWRDDMSEKRDKKAREFRKQFKNFMNNFGSFWI